MEYYIIIDGKPAGPYPAAELPNLGLTPSSKVWRQGMSDWQPASNLPELASLLCGNSTSGYDTSRTVAQPQAGQIADSPENVHPLRYDVTECPPNHLAIAIIGVILFWPLGLSAIIKACLVKKRWNEGRRGDAVWLSEGAKRWGYIASLIGVVIIVISIVAALS